MKAKFLALLMICLALICSLLLLSACGPADTGGGGNEGGTENGGAEGDGTENGGNEGGESDGLPLSVSENGITYELQSDNTYKVYSADTTSATVVIPDKVHDTPVTAVGNAFQGSRTLTSITIGNNVTYIATYAFSECPALKTVVLPDGLVTIGYGAFSRSEALEAITIPASVTTVENEAFNHCAGLKSVTFAEGTALKNFSTNMFSYCYSLKDIVIPDSVEKIGGAAFASAHNLMTVTVGTGVTTIDHSAFSDCYRLAEIYNFSSIDLSLGATEHGGIAKYAKVIRTDNTYESHVITDGNGFVTFAGNTLLGYVGAETEIVVPESVTKINDYAFYKYDTLTSITLGKNVETVGKEVFIGCAALASIGVNEENTSFASEGGALYNADKTTLIRFPENSIEVSPALPASVTAIGDKAFYETKNLSYILIPDNVLTVGKNAFEKCSALTNVMTGNGITTIGEKAFYDCHRLLSVTLGTNVNDIGASAFNNCYRLVEVINRSALTVELGKASGSFLGYFAISIETDPAVQTRLSRDGDFVIHTSADGVKTVVDYVGTENAITVPAGVSVIGNYAFYGLDIITSVTIGEDVTRIGHYSFQFCYSLESVTFAITEGWWRSVKADATEGNTFAGTDLSDTATAANFLRVKYVNTYWNRNN